MEALREKRTTKRTAPTLRRRQSQASLRHHRRFTGRVLAEESHDTRVLTSQSGAFHRTLAFHAAP
eukprot:7376019-Prymnesium_polylepis.1